MKSDTPILKSGTPCLKSGTRMFEDRRNHGERRRRTRSAHPPEGCRRSSGERRHLLRQYHPQPWWLQANYVEELQPPVLATPPFKHIVPE